METVLTEYKAFLQSILDEYSNLTSGTRLSGMHKRLQELEAFIDDYNKRCTAKANEYLNNNSKDNTELKERLSELGREYFNRYTKEHFPFLKPV